MGDYEQELVKLRTNFYCTNYRRMVTVLLLMLIINFTLSGVIIYQVVTCPDSTYFATSQSGNITQIHPLSDPMMPNAEMLKWTADLAVVIYSYNFVNYNEVIQKLQKYFTSNGFESFNNTFRDSKNLTPVINNKIVVSSTVNGIPAILEHGVAKGVYTWKVQIPLLVTYQSPVETTQQPINLIMQVIRTSTSDVAIDALVANNVPTPNQTT